MKIISDKDLLNKYIVDNKIDSLFSFWNKYKVQLVKYEKGETISSKDNPLTHLNFIVSGCIKIYYISTQGKVLSLAFKEGFSLLGDMEFAEEKDCPYAEAVTEVISVSISISQHKELLDHDIKFCRYIIKNLAKKVNQASKTSFLNQIHSTENRLASYILSSENDGIINANWTEAACILSSSYRQLMRLLSKFCDEGLILRLDKKGMYAISDKTKLLKLSSEIFW